VARAGSLASRSQRPGSGARGSLTPVIRPAGSAPRHSGHHRPSRRTGKSVRPAVVTAESRIEPWFAPHAVRPPNACTRPIGAGTGAGGTMPKKTARRARSPRAISSAKQPLGLIVEGTISTRSARTESALDNRSHRTTGHCGHHRTVLLQRIPYLTESKSLFLLFTKTPRVWPANLDGPPAAAERSGRVRRVRSCPSLQERRCQPPRVRRLTGPCVEAIFPIPHIPFVILLDNYRGAYEAILGPPRRNTWRPLEAALVV